jgi:hypothetical protein
MEQRDNYTWNSLRNEFNNSQPNEVLIYNAWVSYDKTRYLNVLVKLGYIKRSFVYNKYVQSGAFERVKYISVSLRWMDAQKEADSLKMNLKKKIKKYTLWNHIVEKINNHDKETFNVYELFPYEKYEDGPNIYLSKIYKLGYLERLDKHRNYKIVEKIPENLSAALAHKLLYDKIYKRQRKITKLREKLSNDNTNLLHEI